MELSVKECPIHSVVVYSDRAEVRRTISVEVCSGESTITVKELSEFVDGDSIRVEGQGSGTILDVTYSTEEKEGLTEATDDMYSSLLEKIKEKDDLLTNLSFLSTVLQNQKKLLQTYAESVTKFKSGNNENDTAFSFNVSPDEVNQTMTFMKRYEAYLSTLDEKLLENSRQKKLIEDEKKVLESKADQLNYKADSINTAEIIRCVKVTVEAEEKQQLTLVISYLVSNASWTPTYDVRVFTKDKAMKIHYHGLIKQSTGEDWDNANLSLSTAKPNIGGSAPQLGIHYVGFKHQALLAVLQESRNLAKHDSYFLDEYDQTIEEIGFCDEPVDMEFTEGAKTSRNRSHRKRASIASSLSSLNIEVAKVDLGQLFNTTYSIPRKATVPADSTEHKVTVAIIDLQPEFDYISVPRLSPHSFLQSSVKNTSPYAILTGPANIFLDNNFLAKSSLPDTSPNEEFTISLGADQSIQVTCHPLKLLRGTSGRITKQNLLTYTYVFSIKNSRVNNVKFKLLEQVPLSTDEKLKVVLQAPDIKKHNVQVPFSHGHSVLNEENNIEWHCHIPASTSIDVQLVYTVEFPLTSIVEGLPSQ